MWGWGSDAPSFDMGGLIGQGGGGIAHVNAACISCVSFGGWSKSHRMVGREQYRCHRSRHGSGSGGFVDRWRLVTWCKSYVYLLGFFSC